MTALPPSHRGQQNVQPDIMIDLSRRVAENTYDKETNPDGIVDLGSAKNELMLDDLERWLKNSETAEDRRNCEFLIRAFAERRSWEGRLMFSDKTSDTTTRNVHQH